MGTRETGIVDSIKGSAITVHVGDSYLTIKLKTKAAASVYACGDRVTVKSENGKHSIG